MRVCIALCVLLCLVAEAGCTTSASPAPVRGGKLVVAERSAPRTFNPVFATDNPSRTILQRLHANLIRINRRTLETEPALASSWTASPDGRQYTLKLRPNLKFSDGHPFTADDVLFTFQVLLDEKVNAPQRELLVIAGKPIGVRKTDDLTIVLTLAEPYAVADRLFDGIAILPKHVLGEAYAKGTLAQQWGLDAPPASIVGLGPFRMGEHVPGERIVLERNPHYWRRDERGEALPYLDTLVFLVIPSVEGEYLRFTAGATDVFSRPTAEQFGTLSRTPGISAADRGPGFEYNFLVFNQNETAPPALAPKQAWFRQEAFRHAISAAIDRQAIVKLVYRGRGEPLWGPVSSGMPAWRNDSIPHPARSTERARALLGSAGFSWRNDGTLLDATGKPVEFNIVVSSSTAERAQMATLIQSDLAQIGIRVTITPLEFRAYVDRLINRKDYEACVFGTASGDADPNSDINVWTSSGNLHVWNLGGPPPASGWQAEIDTLMRDQMWARSTSARKRMFDRVQALLSEHEPVIFLATPNILVAAKAALGNFTPAILPHYALWNADELYWRAASGG